MAEQNYDKHDDVNENKLQLEKVAINDVLPFKAGRRDAIAELKSFGASDLSCRQIKCPFI